MVLSRSNVIPPTAELEKSSVPPFEMVSALPGVRTKLSAPPPPVSASSPGPSDRMFALALPVRMSFPEPPETSAMFETPLVFVAVPAPRSTATAVM